MKISIGVGVRKLGSHRLADSGYSANRGWRSDPFYSRRGLRGAGSSAAWTILFLSARLGRPSAFPVALGTGSPWWPHQEVLFSSPCRGRCDRTDLSLQFPLRPGGPVTCVNTRACAQRWMRSSVWRRDASSCTSQSWLTGDPGGRRDPKESRTDCRGR